MTHSIQHKKTSPRIVQILNTSTGKYEKVDVLQGLVVGSKKTKGPYKGVPIASIKQPIGGLSEV